MGIKPMVCTAHVPPLKQHTSSSGASSAAESAPGQGWQRLRRLGAGQELRRRRSGKRRPSAAADAVRGRPACCGAAKPALIQQLICQGGLAGGCARICLTEPCAVGDRRRCRRQQQPLWRRMRRRLALAAAAQALEERQRGLRVSWVQGSPRCKGDPAGGAALLRLAVERGPELGVECRAASAAAAHARCCRQGARQLGA